MTCVCGGRKPILIRRIAEGDWYAEVEHDGWSENAWFDSWAKAFEWAWWRIA